MSDIAPGPEPLSEVEAALEAFWSLHDEVPERVRMEIGIAALEIAANILEHGRAVGGLEHTKSSARTMILWDGGERWWIGRAAPCTLARCAEILATSSPSGWPVKAALNLDGGRSSELWVSEKISGGPLKSRPLWNRPVRNFLVLE